tara:strand:+ start:1528 stop:2562 length:1035 start_codon:yes stop_codon:yes gene_type:complete
VKKLIVVSVLIASLLIVGCLDYKTYSGDSESDDDLLQQIADIEKELNIQPDDLAGEGVDDIQDVAENALDDAMEDTTEDVVEEVIEVVPQEDKSLLKQINVDENQPVSLNVGVRDLDDDDTTVTFTAPLDENGFWQTHYGDAGEYTVTITASDGKVETTQEVLIVVNRVNVAPEIAPISNMQISEGETVSIDPQVNDPNGDEVAVTFSAPLSEETWVTDHTSSGEYEVTITASDGELESVETFLLTVGDVNELPEVTGLSDITINEGEVVTVEPVVTDLDGDELLIAISDPVGDDGVWETEFTDHGTYPITITINDGKDVVTRTVTVTITDVNVPPEIVEITLG